MTTSVAVTEPTERASASGARQDAGLLVLRLAGFGLLTFHGAQKLFGVFGGPGLSGTTQAFQQMGYEPAIDQEILGPRLVKEYNIRSLTSCSTCHR